MDSKPYGANVKVYTILQGFTYFNFIVLFSINLSGSRKYMIKPKG